MLACLGLELNGNFLLRGLVRFGSDVRELMRKIFVIVVTVAKSLFERYLNFSRKRFSTQRSS